MKRTPQPHDSLVMRALYFVEWLGLLLISLATIVAIGQETLLMVGRGQVLLQDILLLFIYLEILTMVGLYFTSGKLPVRYPIYIAMVAIARFIIMGMKDMTGWDIVALAAAILVLALAVLAIRYGHTRMPYNE
ncbi:MAG TPA: phosphate-starvation-inducible PsiE family protein [Gammaproteobacteria bacterium]|nr:phosphate-starvation-inducible PsiE family protein [Gammaproteobacteria bacterium]